MTSDADRHAAAAPADTVGLIFVGVLFAAVITKVLELSLSPGLTAAGAAQLAVAALLTVTSWIGYHNSSNRSARKITLVNLPFALFMLELAHVYVYWLTAATLETAVDLRPTALPESVCIALTYALYVAWDAVALRIRRSPQYGNQPRSSEEPRRRRVTVATFGIAAVTAAAVGMANPHRSLVVITIDGVLAALVLGHRVGQQFVIRRAPR